MLYSEIDLHQRLIAICTVDENGNVLGRTKMKTQPDLITAYFRQWPDVHRAVVECTTGWYWFCDLLRSIGISVALAHAKYLKAICYAKVKTDAVDALTLAQLLRMGYIPEAYQMSPDYRAMRDLLRQRMVMEHKRTNIIQRVSSILAQFNITKLPVSPYQTGFADFLSECSLPEEYRMTLLLYHQQCVQTTKHRRELEKYFKARLRPTAAVQLLMSIPRWFTVPPLDKNASYQILHSLVVGSFPVDLVALLTLLKIVKSGLHLGGQSVKYYLLCNPLQQAVAAQTSLKGCRRVEEVEPTQNLGELHSWFFWSNEKGALERVFLQQFPIFGQQDPFLAL